ncbi:MAG: L-threonylcarbamoyladenylate synthase [Candidatus Sumerlaeia bacterium]|nr:L-threonylcarbamoyladenylate synthase [Candidatus Sumerlaeia bacterium]
MSKTPILPATPDAVARAAEVLRGGGLVAIPTETVYGLAVRADSDAAVARLYAAKGRPATNPLIVHVPDLGAAERWAAPMPELAARLAGLFWPGPLTLVVPAAAGLSPRALGGGDTVGLRAPDHPVALALLRECGLPLAAPSANASGRLSPTTAEAVLDTLDGLIDLVLDGGACAVGIESTVLDACCDPPRVLRPGVLTAEQLADALGAPVLGVAGEQGPGPARSPGLLTRHYAPSVPLVVGGEAGSGDFSVQWGPGAADAALPLEPRAAAAALFAELRRAERSGARRIVVAEPPPGPEWAGIRDRLRRASAAE